GSHTIDVAQDEVAAERAAEPQGSLQVDTIARAQAGQGRPAEGLWTDLEHESVGAPLDDREAHPVDRDAPADVGAVHRDRRVDLERRDPWADLDRPDRADFLDDPGEHQTPAAALRTSASIRRSSPSAVTDSGPSRTAFLSSRPTPPTAGVAPRPPTRSGAT